MQAYYKRECLVDYTWRCIFGEQDRLLTRDELTRYEDRAAMMDELVSGPWIRFGAAMYRIKLAALRATGEVEQ